MLTMVSSRSIFINIACLSMLLLIHGHLWETMQKKTVSLSKVCLKCICETANNCNVTYGCDGHVCGPFAITWAYWEDAGRLSLEKNVSKNAYTECTKDVHCSVRTIQAYMTKFAQDCNGDGKIDCDDYYRIHLLGGYRCTVPLNSQYQNVYKTCMQTFNKF